MIHLRRLFLRNGLRKNPLLEPAWRWCSFSTAQQEIGENLEQSSINYWDLMATKSAPGNVITKHIADVVTSLHRLKIRDENLLRGFDEMLTGDERNIHTLREPDSRFCFIRFLRTLLFLKFRTKNRNFGEMLNKSLPAKLQLSRRGTKGEPVHLNGHAKLLLVEMEMILDYELLCQPGMFPDEYVSTLLRWYGKYQLESILTFMGILGFSGAEPKQTLLQVLEINHKTAVFDEEAFKELIVSKCEPDDEVNNDKVLMKLRWYLDPMSSQNVRYMWLVYGNKVFENSMPYQALVFEKIFDRYLAEHEGNRAAAAVAFIEPMSLEGIQAVGGVVERLPQLWRDKLTLDFNTCTATVHVLAPQSFTYFRPNGEQYLNLLDFEQDYQAARLGRLGWKVKQRTQHEHYDELADYVVKFDQL